MSQNKLFFTNFRVYAEDTDFMGIVYHANYLRFLERARTDMFREYGLSLPMFAEEDFHFAIHDVSLRYIYPAKLDDILSISTKISTITSCSLVFDQSITILDNKEICQAEIKVVCVNQALKPKRLPKFFFDWRN